MPTRYYHYDGLGSTQLLTDENANVTDSYCNTAFGLPVDTGAANPTVNPFRFVGQLGYYLDPDTGNYYVRARDFSPTLARWSSEDPFGFWAGDRSLYRYCKNGPVIYTDPSGQILLPLVGAAVAAFWWFFTPNVANAPAPGDKLCPANPFPNPAPALAVGLGVSLVPAALSFGWVFYVEITEAVLSPIVFPIASSLVGFGAVLSALQARYPNVWLAIQDFIDPSWGPSLASEVGNVWSGIVVPFLQEEWNALKSPATPRPAPSAPPSQPQSQWVDVEGRCTSDAFFGTIP